MSFEQDPPAVTQPTLPPPPVRLGPPSALGSPLKKLVTIGVAGLCAVGALAAYGLHALNEHDMAKAAAASSTASLTMAQAGDVGARFEKLLAGFPTAGTESTCPDDGAAEPMPLVLHTADGTAPSAFESNLFVGALSGAPSDAATLERVGKARRVAVLRTTSLTEPQRSLGAPTAGRYEATLAVYGARSEAPLCQTHFVVWSSSTVLEPGIPARTLREDFATRVKGAVSDAAARLRVDIDI